MNTSSKFVVATHILTLLAGKKLYLGDCGLSSDQIAVSVSTNPVVIRRLLSKLSQAGLVISKSGPLGGSVISKEPEHINLAEIHNAVEDGSLFHMHYCNPSDECPVGSHIQESLLAILKEAEDSFYQVLSSKTLLDVLNDTLNRTDVFRNKSKEEITEIMKKNLNELEQLKTQDLKQ